MLQVRSRTTIENWLREGAPPREPGGYDLVKWVAWWAARKERNAPPPAEAADTLWGDDPDMRYKAARAESAELDLKTKKACLVPRQWAEERIAFWLRWWRQHWQQLPAELPLRIVGKSPNELRDTIAEYCERVTREALSHHENECRPTD